MKKKAETKYETLLNYLLWIIFFIIAGITLYFLINRLTG